MNFNTGEYTHSNLVVQCDLADLIKEAVEKKKPNFVDLSSISVDANSAFSVLNGSGKSGLVVFEQVSHGQRLALVCGLSMMN